MKIVSKPFGTMPNGNEITLYTLSNKNGLKAEIINLGGIVVSLTVPDRDGKMADILLGYDNLSDYIKNPPFFGAIIGRHANRLEGASFTINGKEYKLNKNEGNNQLHGGIKGFDKAVWDVRILPDGDNGSLELSHFSPDGDEEYPGNLEVRVIYSLTDDNALVIKYFAVSDKDTVVNLTNHAYFNLSGCSAGTILNHELKINADFYTPIDTASLPTGEVLSVKNTPFDFTNLRTVGEGLHNTDNEQIKNGSGYDHNFVLNVSGKKPEEAAEVYDPQSGRIMKVYTTKPGVQLYTGNFLNDAGIGKGGTKYVSRQALCLETQFFPNSMKHRHFPSPVLHAGQTYHHTTIYQFTIK
jgi:aldose 1-epimerase